MVENLAAKLCSLLPDDASSAEQWKLLGQEKNGSLLLGWVEEFPAESRAHRSRSVIGLYDRIKDTLKVLYKFSDILNLVQATVNQSHSLLGYVLKNSVVPTGEPVEKNETEEKGANTQEESNGSEVYEVYVLEIEHDGKVHVIESGSTKQARIQFLYKQKEVQSVDKFLLLVHTEYIQMFTIAFNPGERSIKEMKSESLAKTFIWAQWDATNQVLYHIHRRKPVTSVFVEDSEKSPPKPIESCPTLSGLQFHDDLPHETVLNIPLNLPQVPTTDNCGTYEDDVIPLRVHDCSLDLIVISDSKGIVCVCHHYLYRPVKPPQHVLDSELSDSNTVHFAYSVTVLHHSCVLHCVVPGIPWAKAKLMRPTFALYGDNHMIVFVQDFFTHLLEIGFHHEPCCHILCGPLPNVPSHSSYLVPLLNFGSSEMTNSLGSYGTNILTIDLPTLDLVPLTVPTSFLIKIFCKEPSIEIRCGILHYFVCHKNDLDVVEELISNLAEKPRSLNITKIFEEFLVCCAHTLVQQNLPNDATMLLCLLVVTTMEESLGLEAKVNELNVSLTHEKLWNTSVMLLSPQQRLVPYRSDLWTKLWDKLGEKSEERPRFKPSQIVDKLMLSLACYQPEALSRCSTPMSPAGGLVVTTATLGELMGGRGKYYDSNLPFIEMESCTASKQEHIVAVNLRELSVHLLKYGTKTSSGRLHGFCTPLHVHAMSTRHVTAQLETSRLLCQMLCKAANIHLGNKKERGFAFIDNLPEPTQYLLFTLLERYKHATENVAFPIPQGFTSFFTYLGYRTLDYSLFLQYVQRSVFELQVDVVKTIMADISDDKASLPRKLELLSMLPRSRAKRLLNQWSHPVSFMLRAREHATNILSGEICPTRTKPLQRRNHNGLSAFPSGDRLSPLDTFLDLLTAKASLTELDFELLIEATAASTEDFL